MSIDKKAILGMPKFVVLESIGRASVQKVDADLVARAITGNTLAATA